MKNNWFKDVAEFAALISVVISLLFVGWEIRENSAIARADAYNAWAISVADAQRQLASDPIIAPLYTKVTNDVTDIEELDQEERLRIFAYYQSVLRTWETLHRNVEEGILGEQELTQLSSYSGMFTNPVFNFLWSNRSFRNQYTPEFIEFFVD